MYFPSLAKNKYTLIQKINDTYEYPKLRHHKQDEILPNLLEGWKKLCWKVTEKQEEETSLPIATFLTFELILPCLKC